MSTRQSIMAETDYDPWPEIEAQAAALAGPGASVTAAPSSASLLVSGTPRDVDRVRTWLAWLNREVLRPVTLSVHVYAVRMEREANYGFGLAALVKELFGTSAELAVSPESVAIVRPSAAVGDTLAASRWEHYTLARRQHGCGETGNAGGRQPPAARAGRAATDTCAGDARVGRNGAP